MLDFNSHSGLNGRINFEIDEAMKVNIEREEPRSYLGGSVVGHDCERHVQYHLLAARGIIKRKHKEPRIHRIFDRGKVYEKKCRVLLDQAGFMFDPPRVSWPDMEERQEGFSDFDGQFKGHIDGKIIGWRGADECPIPQTRALWEHKCLGAKGWGKLVKEHLKRYSAVYYGQCQVYMRYMKLPGCLFSATNADTMEMYHEYVDFNESHADLLIKRVSHVIMVTDAGELVPRCTDDKNLLTCKRCEFGETCWK